jgi:CDP-diacylglycerol--glycerol-3-phosphate 3-phosphatidyltransferase
MLSGDSLLVQWALVVYTVAAITDFYDGYVARRMQNETRFGKFLDPLADKFLTVAAFVCFIYLNLIPLWMVIIVVARDIIVTSLRMYAEIKDKPIVTMKSAKWKTFFQLVFIFYTLALLAAAHTKWMRHDFGDFINMLLDPIVMQAAMLGLTLLTVVTGVIYLIENRHLFRTIGT